MGDEGKTIVDKRCEDGDEATLQLPCCPHVSGGRGITEAYKGVNVYM